MVDPVNLNVPGLPYFLFAVAFFAVVFVLVWVLSPLELLVRRHQRLSRDLGGDGGDDDGENDDSLDGDGGSDGSVARFPSGEASAPTIDGLFGTVRRPASREPSAPTVYECRHCGTTLDAGVERCPRCETASVVRYETG